MKRFVGIIFSVLITFISMLGITSVKADNAKYPSKLENVNKNYLINYSGYNLYYKTYSGGYAFCTSFHVQGVGTSCSLSSNQWSTPTQAGIAAIVKKYNSSKSAKNYYYAELAINEFLYYKETADKTNRISSYSDVRNYTGVADFYREAVKAYDAVKANYTVTLSPSTVNFRLVGDYYVSDKITVKQSNGAVGGYGIHLSGDVKSELESKNGNEFYIKVKKSDIKPGTTSNINILVNGKKYMDVAKKFDCGSGNQNMTPNAYTNELLATATATITGKITLKGNKVNITKIDSETKKAVSGAVLSVKNASGKEIAKFTTSEKAYELKNLDAGEYTVTEVEAPEGYKKSNEVVKFMVSNDDKTVNVEFKNDKIKNPVEFSKKDATTSKELPGAHLVVKDIDGNVVDEWVSTEEEHKIKDLKPGKYSLSETIAPEGYRLSTTTVEFEVKGDGSTTKVEMLNEPKDNTKVKINKIDADTKKTVSGATIVVKNKEGKEVLKFKSSDKAKVIDNLEVGEYTAVEVEAPKGYQLNKKAVSFNVSKDDKILNIEILNTKHVTKVEVSKKDATTSKELPGAHLVVKDTDGNVVDEWVSTTEVHIIKGLKEGKYTLSETIAPEGYRLQTTTVEFEVKADGTTTKVEMLNEPMNNTKVKINKIDADTKKTVSGATIVVKNKEGKEVLKFKSSDKAKVIDNLEVGEYTAEEVEAPKGYQLNKKAVSFKVSKDDKTIDVEILNTKHVTKVEVSKKDATTSKELPGAHLVVKDIDGNVVDEWVSTDKVHIIKGLKEGKYTLSETIAPEGYRLQTTTVEFEVKADGTTTKVEMLNEPMNNTKVKINKIDADTKKTVSGATIIVKNKEGKEVLKFKSSDKAKVIDNLEVGEYTAVEVEAPKGYQLNKKAVSFKVNKDDKTVNIEILNTKYVTKVEVSKKDATTSKELPGAHLVVKDSDGNVVDEWVSTEEVHIIKGLKEGKFTLSETAAPEGYRLQTTTVEFEVKADGSTTKVEMLNEPMNNTKVKINKIDADTKETLSGATIVIKNKEGKEVLKFKSGDKAKVIDNLEVGEYTAVEVEAPKGYQLNKKAVSFKVNKDDKTINVEILNTKNVTRVEISKKDATTSKELPGAHLVVKDSDGNVVDEWVSTEEVHIIKELKEGKFTLSETIAPEGYRLQTTTVEFEVKADGSTTKVEMLNEPMNNTKVKINKIDSETKETVSGATIVIKNKEGKEVLKFKSGDKAKVIDNLEVGEYTAVEVEAPKGYQLNKKAVSFKVNKDDKTINVEILNTKNVTRVEVSKKDATTSKELPGAHLVVKDSDGNVVDEWVSTEEVHIIKGLKEGKFTLSETIAPEGYRLQTTTVEFEVKADGSTTKVEMLNEPMNNTKVKINKIDADTKETLEGATLVIKDSKGNEVKSFVTTKESHEISDLELGTYTVSETKAPEGYELSNEVKKFTVSRDDKEITVDFTNRKTPEVNTVEISKKDATTSEELPGAHLVVKNSEGKVIDEWVSTDEVHIIKGIEAGTYTLTETIAPEGYVLSESTVEFTVKDDGTTTKVVMYNSKENTPVPPVPENPSKHQVEISKQDITTKSELPGATLIIKDAYGNEIDRWVSGTTPHYIELDEGDYTLTEVQAPIGYDLSYEVVKFSVSDTTDIARVVMYNSKTPNTADRNITSIIGMMFISLLGIGGSVFKLKTKKNS